MELAVAMRTAFGASLPTSTAAEVAVMSIAKRRSGLKKKKPTSQRTAKAARPRRATRAIPEASEPIRIVPLHYPKPTYSVEELRSMQAAAAGDLYDGRPRLAPATAKLTYRRGPLLQKFSVYSIYWGASWNSSASAPALRRQIDQFFKDILVSPLMDQLAEYNVSGQTIGHGQYLGSTVRTDFAPVGSVTDSTIRAQLLNWLKTSAIPKNTSNSLYFIYLEPGIVSIMGGSKSCQNYCGYHDAVGSVYYAVMPYPLCAGCLGGLAVIDAITGTSSHELCEAITDPVPGTGWYDDVNGEIGDICAWNFKKIGSHTVQQEWSNAQNRCV